jgi:DNA primase
VVDHPYLRERGVPEALAATFGLTFAEKGIMAGRVCIPIHNAAGELVAYAGRHVGPDETIPADEGKYKLPPAFHKNLELFNLHRVKRCRHLVIAEGFFGTIALHGHRVPAVGLMGSSISDAQIALLVHHCPNLRFVTVLLDGDEAGRKASELVAGKLAWYWPVRIGALPQDMQPDTTPLPALMHAIGRDR